MTPGFPLTSLKSTSTSTASKWHSFLTFKILTLFPGTYQMSRVIVWCRRGGAKGGVDWMELELDQRGGCTSDLNMGWQLSTEESSYSGQLTPLIHWQSRISILYIIDRQPHFTIFFSTLTKQNAAHFRVTQRQILKGYRKRRRLKFISLELFLSPQSSIYMAPSETNSLPSQAIKTDIINSAMTTTSKGTGLYLKGKHSV